MFKYICEKVKKFFGFGKEDKSIKTNATSGLFFETIDSSKMELSGLFVNNTEGWHKSLNDNESKLPLTTGAIIVELRSSKRRLGVNELVSRLESKGVEAFQHRVRKLLTGNPDLFDFNKNSGYGWCLVSQKDVVDVFHKRKTSSETIDKSVEIIKGILLQGNAFESSAEMAWFLEREYKIIVNPSILSSYFTKSNWVYFKRGVGWISHLQVQS